MYSEQIFVVISLTTNAAFIMSLQKSIIKDMTIFRQIPSYDHAKHTILNAELMKEGPALHVISSMIAGFMTALTTSPVDVIKTRIMNQKSHGKVM